MADRGGAEFDYEGDTHPSPVMERRSWDDVKKKWYGATDSKGARVLNPAVLSPTDLQGENHYAVTSTDNAISVLDKLESLGFYLKMTDVGRTAMSLSRERPDDLFEICAIGAIGDVGPVTQCGINGVLLLNDRILQSLTGLVDEPRTNRLSTQDANSMSHWRPADHGGIENAETATIDITPITLCKKTVNVRTTLLGRRDSEWTDDRVGVVITSVGVYDPDFIDVIITKDLSAKLAKPFTAVWLFADDLSKVYKALSKIDNSREVLMTCVPKDEQDDTFTPRSEQEHEFTRFTWVAFAGPGQTGLDADKARTLCQYDDYKLDGVMHGALLKDVWWFLQDGSLNANNPDKWEVHKRLLEVIPNSGTQKDMIIDVAMWDRFARAFDVLCNVKVTGSLARKGTEMSERSPSSSATESPTTGATLEEIMARPLGPGENKPVFKIIERDDGLQYEYRLPVFTLVSFFGGIILTVVYLTIAALNCVQLSVIIQTGGVLLISFSVGLSICLHQVCYGPWPLFDAVRRRRVSKTVSGIVESGVITRSELCRVLVISNSLDHVLHSHGTSFTLKNLTGTHKLGLLISWRDLVAAGYEFYAKKDGTIFAVLPKLRKISLVSCADGFSWHFTLLTETEANCFYRDRIYELEPGENIVVE